MQKVHRIARSTGPLSTYNRVMQITPAILMRPQAHPSQTPLAAPGAQKLDQFEASQPPLEIYSPASLTTSPVERAVTRMLRGTVSRSQVQTLAQDLQPFGGPLLNKLADNGLTIVVPEEGYAHYSIDKKQITFPKKDLDKDTEGVPFREYMIVHEMAHALDFLLEPAKGPLSERAELGIDTHRGKMNELYQPVLQRFEQIKAQRQAEGTWGSSPRFPTARVYGEDFMTVVEKVTGQSISERPARGHLSILAPSTRPTEYFADAVYTYLHSEPVSNHRYTLPDGQPIVHSYPPTRETIRARDPKMFQALQKFFSDPNSSPENFKVN